METLKIYQQKIEEGILNLNLPSYPTHLYEPINYILAIGGKRLRPTLVFIGCDLFNGDLNDALKPALAIEVFHNFTLMHDDIMDEAPLRRGKETVHKRWNLPIAILSGDAMFVKAQQLMMHVPDNNLRIILDTFNKTALEVCEGQQMDMDFESMKIVTIPNYIQMIRLKTAVLLGCSLKIGALIAGANELQANTIYNIGLNLGIAFQLQDDILDVYGDPNKFGKQVGGDIIANKKTFLLLKALELASLNPYKKEELNTWLLAGAEHANDKVCQKFHDKSFLLLHLLP